MTRARQTLLLARLARPTHLTDALPASPAIPRRQPVALPLPPLELCRVYRQLALGEGNISLAGRYPPHHPIHRALAALAPGDRLQLWADKGGWSLRDAQQQSVGRLAAAFAPPPATRGVAVRVGCIVVARREDSLPQYQARLRCPQWEVILPEIVFSPSGAEPATIVEHPCERGADKKN